MLTKKLLFLGITLLATSCSSYRSQFDCCPSKGVPCTSVSKIESMIVETKEGPDLFTALEMPGRCLWKNLVFSYSKQPTNKVWIGDTFDSCGNRICGHYIFFKKDGG